MLHCFDFVREMDLLGVTARLVLAVLCGGIIGIEREVRRRPAGFRTHILICMGSAITVLTNIYLYQVMHLFTDVARMGAQVIAGIGFVGGGTIIVTKRQYVKGLTTAAGLWTSSIIGLACGAGYAECAIFATSMVLFAELVLMHLEHKLLRQIRDVNIYVEFLSPGTVQKLVQILRGEKIAMNDLEVNRISLENGETRFSAIMKIRISREQLEKEIVNRFENIGDVMKVEEL